MTAVMRVFKTASLTMSFATAAVTVHAADLAGVHLPDHQTVAGTELTLNGAAIRTATILHVPVYVAGLYLEQPSQDAEQIVTSPQPKLLRFVFLRNISADRARSDWQKTFAENCTAPCQLPAEEVSQFISRLPPMNKGDIADVAFTQQGADFTINGIDLGRVTDPNFVRVILLGYIGPKATSPAVRNGILGKP